jgi:tetratricopeptide (TPR) repeat protein
VDEIILVDSESTDGSQGWAKELSLQHRKVKYFSQPWPNHFATQRNFALSKATSDWILFLDADEEVTEVNMSELQALLSNLKVDAYETEIRNYTAEISEMGFQLPDSKSLAPYGHVTTKLHRLFRRDPQIRYEGAIHERIEPSLDRLGKNKASCSILIHHWGKIKESSLGTSSQRLEFYRKLAESKLAEQPEDPQTLWELGIILLKKRDYSTAENYLYKAHQKAPHVEEFEKAHLLSLYHQRSFERLVKNSSSTRTAQFFKALANAERGTAALNEVSAYEDIFSQAPLMAFEISLRKGNPEQIRALKTIAYNRFGQFGIPQAVEGHWLRSEGQYDKAVPVLLEAWSKGQTAIVTDLFISWLKLKEFIALKEFWNSHQSKIFATDEIKKMVRLAEISPSLST